MITEVFLIRHAESAKNLRPDLICGRSPEVPLSELGQEQAAKLGHFLVRNAIIPSEVHSSPAARAIETAKIALDTMGLHLPIQENDDLHEMSQGEWEHQPVVEMFTDTVMERMSLLGRDFSVPGGESTRDVGRRMNRWLKTTAHTEEVHFAFTHSFAIRSVLADLFDWSHEQISEAQTGNTSVTHLVNNGRWLLVDFARMPD